MHQKHRLRIVLLCVVLLILGWPSPPSVRAQGAQGRIVFVSIDETSKTSELYAINPDGTGLVRLTQNTVNDGHPSISPDGGQIVFTSDNKGGTLFLMNADGSNQRPLLKKADPTAAFPDWSPDGKTIAFVSKRDGNDEIYAVDVNGEKVQRLTNDAAQDWDPAWSPDGTRIAFTSDRTGKFGIYVMNADGGTVRPVTKNPNSEMEPHWTVDGKRINYTRHTTVYISNVDGTNARALLSNAFGVVWSPDGTQYVFCRPGNMPDVFVASANGRNVKQLTKNKTPDYWATWGK